MSNPFEVIDSRLSHIELQLATLNQKLNAPKITGRNPIKIDRVIEITDYAESTIRGKVSRREIPYHKKGGRVFFFEDEIINWIKEGRQKTKSEIEAEV